MSSSSSSISSSNRREGHNGGPRNPVTHAGACLGCIWALLDNPYPNPNISAMHDRKLLWLFLGLVLGPVLTAHVIDNPSYNPTVAMDAVYSHLGRTFISSTAGSGGGGGGGPLSVMATAAAFLAALYIVMAVNIIPYPHCDRLGDSFSFSTSSYLLYLSGIAPFDQQHCSGHAPASSYFTSSIVQLCCGICLSSLLSSSLVYTIETSLSSRRGGAACSLASSTFLSARGTLLMMKAYRSAAQYLFAGTTLTPKPHGTLIKVAMCIVYALIFIVLPLGLCLEIVVRCVDMVESPRWLLAHRAPRDCASSLQQLRGTRETTVEFNVMYRYLAIDVRRGYSYLDMLKPLFLESPDSSHNHVPISPAYHPSASTASISAVTPATSPQTYNRYGTNDSIHTGATSARVPEHNATGGREGGGSSHTVGDSSRRSSVEGGNATLAIKEGGNLSPIFVMTSFVFIAVTGLFTRLSVGVVASSLREIAQQPPILSQLVDFYIPFSRNIGGDAGAILPNLCDILVIVTAACGCELNRRCIDRSCFGRRRIILIAALTTTACSTVLLSLLRTQSEVPLTEYESGGDLGGRQYVLIMAGTRAALLLCLAFFAIPNLHFFISPLLIYITESSPYRLRGKFVSLYLASYFIITSIHHSSYVDKRNSTAGDPPLRSQDLVFIAVVGVIFAVFTFVLVPETRALMLEDIDRALFDIHSYCGFLADQDETSGGVDDVSIARAHPHPSTCELSFIWFPYIALERRFASARPLSQPQHTLFTAAPSLPINSINQENRALCLKDGDAAIEIATEKTPFIQDISNFNPRANMTTLLPWIRVFGMKRVPKKDLMINVIARTHQGSSIPNTGINALYSVTSCDHDRSSRRIPNSTGNSGSFSSRFSRMCLCASVSSNKPRLVHIDLRAFQNLQDSSPYPSAITNSSRGQQASCCCNLNGQSDETPPPEMHRMFSSRGDALDTGGGSRSLLWSNGRSGGSSLQSSKGHKTSPHQHQYQQQQQSIVGENAEASNCRFIGSSNDVCGDMGLIRPESVHQYSAAMARQSWKYLRPRNNLPSSSSLPSSQQGGSLSNSATTAVTAADDGDGDCVGAGTEEEVSPIKATPFHRHISPWP